MIEKIRTSIKKLKCHQLALCLHMIMYNIRLLCDTKKNNKNDIKIFYFMRTIIQRKEYEILISDKHENEEN